MKKKKSWKLAKNITGISTGYKVIDQLFNGLQPGELMLIGGTPLSGKSTLALNIAINVMKETRKKVVIFDCNLFKISSKVIYIIPYKSISTGAIQFAPNRAKILLTLADL